MSDIILIIGIAAVLSGAGYTSLILLFTYGWYRLTGEFQRSGSDLQPFVSIVIAARNEEQNIVALLEDLLRQDYPEEKREVIVIDDFSDDGTFERVSEFISKHDLARYFIFKREGDGFQGSKKAALTKAIQHAKGEVILATDSDCRVQPGWVGSMAMSFTDQRVMLAAGPVAYEGMESMADRFQSLEFLGLVASGAGAIGAGYPFLCNGACLAFRREAFAEVGGYEGNVKYKSGDDVFLLHKVKKTYGRSAIFFNHDPESLVKTSPVDGMGAFIRQRARWASKSSGYSDSVSILTALSVLSFSMTALAAFIVGFFMPESFLLFAAIILFKSLVDFPLLYGMTGFTCQRELMRWLLPFQVIYPLYVFMAGITSLFMRKRW